MIVPRLPRLEYPNAIYHVITWGDGRRQLFYDDRHYERFTQGLIDEVHRSSSIIGTIINNRCHPPSKMIENKMPNAIVSQIGVFGTSKSFSHSMVLVTSPFSNYYVVDPQSGDVIPGGSVLPSQMSWNHAPESKVFFDGPEFLDVVSAASSIAREYKSIKDPSATFWVRMLGRQHNVRFYENSHIASLLSSALPNPIDDYLTTETGRGTHAISPTPTSPAPSTPAPSTPTSSWFSRITRFFGF